MKKYTIFAFLLFSFVLSPASLAIGLSSFYVTKKVIKKSTSPWLPADGLIFSKGSLVKGQDDPNNIPLFYAHGYPDCAENLASYWNNYPYDTYTFDYKDLGVPFYRMRESGLYFTSAVETVSGLVRTNLGQQYDITTTLSALRHAYYAEERKVGKGNVKLNVCGHSRGAASVIGVLAVIDGQHSSGKKILKSIEMSEEERVAIKTAIEKGKIALHCPLLSIASLPYLTRAFLYTFTNTSMFAPSAYKLLEKVVKNSENNFKIMLFTAFDDKVVGHSFDNHLLNLSQSFSNKFSFKPSIHKGHVDIWSIVASTAQYLHTNLIVKSC